VYGINRPDIDTIAEENMEIDIIYPFINFFDVIWDIICLFINILYPFINIFT